MININNEKVDIIPYSADARLLLQAALAPAEGLKIDIDDKIRLVVVTAPDDQLSLVIGRGGQNVRLAAKLTGYQITIKSASGEVQSSVTGKEDYEIDTFGLQAETREVLIQHKLTTLADLVRFRDKWVNMNEVVEVDQKILLTKVDEYLAEEANRE